MPFIIGILVCNIACMLIFGFSVWYNFGVMVCIMTLMILVYNVKSVHEKPVQAIDVFLVLVAALVLSIISILCWLLIPNYIVALIVNRISILSVLIVGSKTKIIKSTYNLYCSSWNRNDNVKLKPLTVRNVSLISLNLFLLVCNYFMIYYAVQERLV